MPPGISQKGKRQAETQGGAPSSKLRKLAPKEVTEPQAGTAHPTHSSRTHTQQATASSSSAAFLEGEISPKNLGGNPGGGLKRAGSPSANSTTSTSGLLFPPPPKKRRRLSPTPPVSGLTCASIEALLPGSTFGHAAHIFKERYWTLKNEKALRKDWSSADETQLLALGTSDAEVMVWRTFTSLYNCTPSDLFRYGLKRDSPADEKANSAFWQAMLRLIVHPFWGGDVAALRYGLQLASMSRAGPQGHVRPLAPPWSHTEPQFLDWVRESHATGPRVYRQAERELELAEVAEFRSTAQVINRSGMEQLEHELRTVIYHLVKQGYLSDRGPGSSPPVFSSFLFMLGLDEVLLVEKALSRMHRGPENEDGPDFLKAWWDTLQGRDREVTAHDVRDVVQKKRMAIIDERREVLIRHHMHATNSRHCLLDIPPFDPDPGFHMYSDVKEAQLLVVRGKRPPPETYRWAKEKLGISGNSMTTYACGIMSQAFGLAESHAGALFDRKRNRTPVGQVEGTHRKTRQNLAGLLFSSYIAGWPGQPPQLMGDLMSRRARPGAGKGSAAVKGVRNGAIVVRLGRMSVH